MLNTPPTFSWYMAGKVFKWLKKEGGLEAIKIKNMHRHDVISPQMSKKAFKIEIFII